MTFSPKLRILKHWPVSSWIPLLAFLALFTLSSFVGLTDDESYYWVLAQKPALGYAYHPPMVAWLIFLSQKIMGPLFGPSAVPVVRLFSCMGMALLLFLSLDWLKVSGARKNQLTSALVLLSFAGVFALGWMMVPDVPLFIGWALALNASWKIGYLNEGEGIESQYLLLALGVCIGILGKYSGILIPISAMFSVLLGTKGRQRVWKTAFAVSLGALVAVSPIVIWNSQHEWQSILYQIHERHQDAEFSLKRYLRFWVIELFAAGPFLVFFSLNLLRRTFFSKITDPSERRILKFISCWMLPPALIYLLQPLWSDFKPHWAFIVWLPGALALAWEVGKKKVALARVQIVYGLLLTALVWVSMHYPLMSIAVHQFKGADFDPRLDVTNDLYGWNRLKDFVVEQAQKGRGATPVIASRYQTASQAATALGSLSQVSLLPRDLKARDEWPELAVTDGIGPQWPSLLKPVFFVGDNRYDSPPQFRSSRCIQLASLDSLRKGLLAKRILIWECKPISWQD